MKNYTVFCQSDIEVGGTTWIGHVEADGIEQAKQFGIAKCSVDWDGYEPHLIRVMGIAAGDVEILEWQD